MPWASAEASRAVSRVCPACSGSVSCHSWAIRRRSQVRERVAFAPEQVGEALVDACEVTGGEESVILSTCKRTELYAIVPEGVAASDQAQRLIDWVANYHHLSARELHKELEKLDISVNKTTVYREIVFLLKTGYLNEINLKSREISYEPKDLMHHHHLVCETCGKVDNITNCLVKELEGDVLKKKGFKIERHSLEFYGTCSKCQKK